MLTEELLRTPLQCQNTSVCKLMSHISLCFWFFFVGCCRFFSVGFVFGFFLGGGGGWFCFLQTLPLDSGICCLCS